MTDRINKLTNIYHDYTNIEYATELKRRHITYAEYQAFPRVFKEIEEYGKGLTFMTGLANYFKQFGFAVKLDENNVNYEIVA